MAVEFLRKKDWRKLKSFVKMVTLMAMIFLEGASTVSAKTIVPATVLTSAKSTAMKKLTVKCKKKNNISGYQVQVALSEDFKSGSKKKNSSGKTKNTLTITGLKSGRVYYIRARTYKKVKGKKVYSQWSNVKTARIKIYHNTSVYGSGLSSKKKAQVTKAIDNFIKKKIKAGMTETQICDEIFAFMQSLNVDAEYTLPYKHHENTAWAVFCYGHAACSGCSRAFKAVFDSLGITSKIINEGQWRHQWVRFKVDGEWYETI